MKTKPILILEISEPMSEAETEEFFSSTEGSKDFEEIKKEYHIILTTKPLFGTIVSDTILHD